MNIDTLRSFVAIFDTKSVSDAAETLGITQSGASAALARLRVELDDPLFLRTARGMEPTPKARSIIESARRMIDAADDILAPRVQFDPRETTDCFTVVAGDILEAAVLQRLVVAFKTEAPHARLSSRSFPQHQLEEAMALGRLDACIGCFDNFGANIMATNVAKITFACFCRPDHPLAGRSISLKQFSEAKYALMEGESNLTNVFEKWLHSQGIERNITVRTSHFHAISGLIATGETIAFVPTDMEGRWFFEGKVERIDIPFKPPTNELKVYWHKLYHKDERNRWFRRILTQQMRDPAVNKNNLP